MIDAEFLERITSLNDQYHIFSEMLTEVRRGGKFHFSAKDNLCTLDMQSRAGSRILDGYLPPFDATSVHRMREAGGVLIGKTNMDEFGFGSFCINSGYGVPRNPFDPERSCGGSSGGSAAAACLIEGHISLAESTGGSIAAPASFCGVVGFTPTYGRVSRYGLIDYANSLDKIGLIGRSASQVAMFYPIIAGPDEKDPTTCTHPPVETDAKIARRIGLMIPEEGIDPVIRNAIDSAIGIMERDMGIEFSEVNLPSLRFALPAQYLLAASEASTNLARYCGMRFGVRGEEISQHFDEFFSGVRSKYLGKEAKRRVLLGTFSRMLGFRDRYYTKALSVREMVIEDYQRIFAQCDAIVTPTMPCLPPRLSEVREMRPLDTYLVDVLTVPPNLAGLPHISLPCGYPDGLPVGMMLIGPHWRETDLLRTSIEWERFFKYRFPEVRE